MTTDLDRLIEAVEADDNAAFRRYNRAVFATPAQDVGLQLREDDSCRAYRGSVDAAIALLEALLPGWDWSAHGNGQATLWPPGSITQQNAGAIDTEIEGKPARALLLATLRAYRSTTEGG